MGLIPEFVLLKALLLRIPILCEAPRLSTVLRIHLEALCSFSDRLEVYEVRSVGKVKSELWFG